MTTNKKITDLTELVIVDNADVIPVVDVSEGNINERNKKVSIGTLLNSLGLNSPLVNKGDIYVRDSVGNSRLPIGGNGQFLSVNPVTTTGLQWIDPPGFDSPLTTKGDLLTFNVDNIRQGVGANGQVLTADSSTPTGLRWTTPEGGEDYLVISSTGPLPQATGTNAAALGQGSTAAGNNSIQLGTGTNIVDDSLQFKAVTIANDDGVVTGFNSPGNYSPTSITSVDDHLQAIDLAIGSAGETVAKFATEQSSSFTLDDTFHGEFIPVNTASGNVVITLDPGVRAGFQAIIFHKGNTNQIVFDSGTQAFFARGNSVQNDNATATLAYDGATSSWYAIGDLI